MASSKAKTVEEYLAELPEDRRTVIASVRALVNRHIPDGYVEAMSWGMIAWEVPLARYPTTYNKQPLPYVALAARGLHRQRIGRGAKVQEVGRGDHGRLGRRVSMAGPSQSSRPASNSDAGLPYEEKLWGCPSVSLTPPNAGVSGIGDRAYPPLFSASTWPIALMFRFSIRSQTSGSPVTTSPPT